jgi:hypothetical protein
MQTCIHKGKLPIDRRALHRTGFAAGHIDNEIGMERVVVQKERLHVLRLVAERQQKLIMAEMGIDAHDMPEHRKAADRDHRLRDVIGVFGEPRAETAGQEKGSHSNLLSL